MCSGACKNPSPCGLGFLFASISLNRRLSFFVGKFRSLLDHVAAAIADLGRIKSGFHGFHRSFHGSGNRGDFGNRSGRSFNRDTRSERTAFGLGFSNRGLSLGSRSGLFGRSSDTSFTTRTAIAAFTTRATFLTLFVTVTTRLGLVVLTAIFTIVLVRTILAIAIFPIVAFTALSHFLSVNRATRGRLQVHVRGELLENRGTKHREKLVNLSKDNNAKHHYDERACESDYFHLGTS